jgi:3-hydroxy-9,10-secoandrosta-1,3,5(10)-triene-9,17-dione monooxygenase reductase component
VTETAPRLDLKHEFRKAVGSFPTGVCVVTAEHDGRPAGMTLNSFTSVSLEPLLVLVSLAHETRTLGVVRSSGRFALSILHRGQRHIALEFAAKGSDFPHHLVRRTKFGFHPVREALAELYCDVHDVVTTGDHDLVIGQVEEFIATAGEPLVFHAGQFGGVDPDTPAPRSFIEFLDEGIGW